MSEYKGYRPRDKEQENNDAEYYESLKRRRELFIKEHGKSNFSELLFWQDIIKEYEQIENTPWSRIEVAMRGNSLAYTSLINELRNKKKRSKKEEEIWLALDYHDTESTLRDISPELGGKFDSHGFHAGELVSNLTNILDNGIGKERFFNTIQLRTNEGGRLYFGTGFDGPPTDSEFFIVSGHEQTLNYNGVEFVILSDRYKDSINLFRRRFPKVEFVLLEDLKTVLERKTAEAGGGK